MEDFLEYNYRYACRACGNKNAEIPLARCKDVFESCTGIALSLSDLLMPLSICGMCVKQLNVCYSFKQRCLRTDKKMRELRRRAMETLRQSSDRHELNHSYDISTDDISNGNGTEINLADPFELATSEATPGEEYIDYDNLYEHSSMVESTECSPLMAHGSEQTAGKVAKERIVDLLSLVDVEQVSDKEHEVNEEPIYLAPDHLDEEASPINGEAEISGHLLTIDFVQSFPERSPTSPMATSQPKPDKFPCVECRKEFSTKTNLNRHQASHNGNKPFRCDICFKGFTQSGSLKTHRFTHSNIKPYVCGICNERFTQKKSLMFHIRRHTGEKPFSCDVCMASFRQKSCLVRHQQKQRHVLLTSRAQI